MKHSEFLGCYLRIPKYLEQHFDLSDEPLAILRGDSDELTDAMKQFVCRYIDYRIDESSLTDSGTII